ncbi:hypothetical protein [Nocardia grenadensis]|uniref:hypothetical protein n=1 Tax=Nocardia grenadensis TaxID=931537 RepID=UPI0007A3A6DD|nr:hypothetical protein [Nocardia grenadensis]
MTLFVALVGVGTFGFIAYDYVVHESRIAELLGRYRPLGSATEEATNSYELERIYRDLDAARSYRERDAA